MKRMRGTFVFALLTLATVCLIGFAVEQPILNISRSSGSKISLSWSTTNTDVFLQETADPSKRNGWSMVSTAPSGVGSFQFTVTTGSNQFFRLSSATNVIDVPDPNFQDTNGDGI